MADIFQRPNEEQVKEWYRWALSLNHKKNPFDPSDGGRNWKVNNNDESLIWLAGVTGRIPREKAVQNLDDIGVSTVLYDDGQRNLSSALPNIVPRKIDIKDDPRNLFIPVLTEYSTREEYSGLEGISLSDIAKKIIDREDDDKGIPPASVDLDDTKQLTGQDLKNNYLVEGTIDDDDDNVFLLPRKLTAAFSGYYVILNRKALESGEHTLKFGVKGRYFNYEMEYKIAA
ncbi:MAG TPA: hypothetical protein VFZ67_02915 [Nitrososphaera sp.]